MAMRCGIGHLEHVDRTDLQFTCSLFKGEWYIHTIKATGFFGKNKQVISRIK